MGTGTGVRSGSDKALGDDAAHLDINVVLQDGIDNLDRRLDAAVFPDDGAALQVNPEIILKIVNDAINSLPHFNQNAHLLLHPDDAELVKNQMGEQLAHAGWKLFPDKRISRGGCRVETAHSHIDATTEMRWQRIVEAIGQDKSWMT